MPSYEEHGHATYKINDEGERIQVSNFTARIIRETRIVDGASSETTLTLVGHIANKDPDAEPLALPEIDVPANQFPGMSWVMQAWGVRAIIFPGSALKEDLRTAIQIKSRPSVRTIFRSIGWTEINGKKAYLHAGGAITEEGNDPTVTIRLPAELGNYDVENASDPKAAFIASLELTDLAPKHVAWPMWAATYAPLFGAVDFATHLTGRSGTFKSELISLFQSHYGPKMDARHLPGSWSSTANALECQAYFAANAPFVVDDFVPVGTSWQVRAYQTSADKIIRSQGNQSGRARLSDTASLQTAYYPRGIIMSTGEDTPEGHSVRARMLIMELSPGDIKPDMLSLCQKNRGKFSAAIKAVIINLCKKPHDLTPEAERIRNENIEIGHTRTPPMLGRLIAAAEYVIKFAEHKKWIDAKMSNNLRNEMHESILIAGRSQRTYLETADPVEIFMSALRQVMGANQAHLRTVNGGIPRKPTILGWTEENVHNEVPNFKSHGPCIGWIDWNTNDMFVDVNTGYNVVRKIAGQELAMTKQTLFKRMKDAGVLTRTDEGRQRNSVRITAEGHPRQVLCFGASEVLETNETPGDEE